MSYLIEPRSFKQKINYRAPINMRPEWSHLFKPDDKYLDVKLGVRKLSNVFVNHYGLVIKNGLLVPGCAPNIGFSNYDHGFYFEHWKKAAEQMLVSRFGKSIPSIRLDDDRTYLVIHSPWFNYYFWLTECLPRLLAVEKILGRLVLIYPESWESIHFVQDTLKMFPQLNYQKIPRDHHLFVKNLVMPEVKPWTPMLIPELVQEVRSFLLSSSSPSTTNGQKIYISRRKANRRKMSDESRVETILKNYGFNIVDPDGLSLYDQITTVNSAKSVISITGAGLTNIMFMKSGSRFLDMTNKQYLHKRKYRFHYWKLCNIVNAGYLVQFCEHENDPTASNYTNQNLIPDYELFEENVQLLTEA